VKGSFSGGGGGAGTAVKGSLSGGGDGAAEQVQAGIQGLSLSADNPEGCIIYSYDPPGSAEEEEEEESVVVRSDGRVQRAVG